MLTVTAVARDHLALKLTRKKAEDDVAIRLTRRAGRWKLQLGHARPADTAITHKGRTLLLLGEMISKRMTDMTLDVKDTKTGPRLTLR